MSEVYQLKEIKNDENKYTTIINNNCSLKFIFFSDFFPKKQKKDPMHKVRKKVKV